MAEDTILWTVKLVPDTSDLEKAMKKFTSVGVSTSGGASGKGGGLTEAVIGGAVGGALVGLGMGVIPKLLEGMSFGLEGVMTLLKGIGKLIGMMVMPFANLLIPLLLPILYLLRPVVKALNLMMVPVFLALMELSKLFAPEEPTPPKVAEGVLPTPEIGGEIGGAVGGKVGADVGITITTSIGDTITNITEGFETFGTDLITLWNSLGLIISTVGPVVLGAIGFMFANQLIWIGMLGNILMGNFHIFVELFAGLWDMLTSAIAGDWEGVLEGADRAVDGIIDGLVMIGTAIVDAFIASSDLIIGIFNAFGLDVPTMQESMDSFISGVVGLLGILSNSVGNLSIYFQAGIASLTLGVATMVSSIMNLILQGTKYISTDLSVAILDMGVGLTDMVFDLGQQISDMVEGFFTAIQDAIQKMINAIGFGGGGGSGGKETEETLAEQPGDLSAIGKDVTDHGRTKESFNKGDWGDFIFRPGQAPASFSPNDTLIGVKDPSKLGGGGKESNIEVNMPINIHGEGGLTQRQIDEIIRQVQTRLQSQKISSGGFI